MPTVIEKYATTNAITTETEKRLNISFENKRTITEAREAPDLQILKRTINRA